MASTTATATIQRPLRGSRISSFYPIKSLPSLASLDSAFQLQEYISLLIRLDVHDVESIVAMPRGGKGKGREGSDGGGKDGGGKVEVDEACWKYEQLRRLAQDLSHPLITMLQQVCTRTTCPEMKAGEWLYLCVAHGNDGAMEQCCAIDYILHTLDSATALLNSPRAFPSRLQIPPASHRHFTSLARRLGRIFAHAYFHHREEFEQAEAESALYARFLALTERFDLVPADFLVIPPRVHTEGRGEGKEGGERGQGGRGGAGVATGDALPPTLGGAALLVDTIMHSTTASSDSADSAHAADEARAQSASPPGLDVGDVASPQRRVGRSRTDTMMLEGESGAGARFPASPASAVEEGAGLEQALAAAGLGRGTYADAAGGLEKEAQEDTNNTEATSAEGKAGEAQVHEQEEAEQEQEEEQDRPSHLTHAPEPPHAALEPPSPTSEELAQQQAQAAEELALGLVSPSSSTALSGGELLGGGEPKAEVEVDSGEGEEAEKEAEKGEEGEGEQKPVPTIQVEVATPPAVDALEEGWEVKDADATASQTAEGAEGEQEKDKSAEGTGGAREAVARAEGVVRGELAAAVAQKEEEEAKDEEAQKNLAADEAEKGDTSPREEDVGATVDAAAAETKPEHEYDQVGKQDVDEEVDVTDRVGDEAKAESG
ncbi:Mob1/phocein [Mycena filopes]|nr:Mob1/phocein [Mycena filopes]